MSDRPDRYARVITAVLDQVWAILPSKLDAITSLLELRAAGLTLSEQDIEARIGNPNAGSRRELEITGGGVGVLPVFGVLSQRLSLFSAISGGTSTERLGSEFRALRDDPKAKAILLAIDSPGGSVYGLDELAHEIRAARGQKPIIAAVDSMAASGAYWLAAQADKVYVTPGGDVGHIGVIGMHNDLTAANEKLGVKTTLFSAGKYKTEGHPLAGPLSDDAKAAMQRRVDQAYARFVRAVAEGRGVTEAMVRAGYGQGRLLTAEDAKADGLVDGIETTDAVIARLEQDAALKSPRAGSPRAESTSPSHDTPQEPAGVTGQDHARGSRRPDAMQSRIEIAHW